MFRLQPHNWYEARLCLEGDEGDGSGGGGGGGRSKERGSDLLERFGSDAMKLAEKLADALNDNYSLRRKRDELTGEVATLKANQKPEGAVVLTGDDATDYGAYRELGKPEEIKTRLDERDSLSARVTKAERDTAIRGAARAYGYDEDALIGFVADAPLAPHEAQEDGKAVTKYRIGEGAEQADLADWVAKQPAYVGRALATDGATGQGQRPGGVRYPAQQGSGNQGTPPSAGQSYIANKYGPRT